MDKSANVFEVECVERNGTYLRAVAPIPLSLDNLKFLWEKLSAFPTLFNRHVITFQDFAATFISQDREGGIRANGLLWAVDDIGVLYLTDIYPGYQVTGHFTFWDKKIRGREELLQRFIQYVFAEFEFHRFVCEVPLFSLPTIAAVERVGFIKEGRLRKAIWYREEWWDANIYSILKEEAHGLRSAARNSSSSEDRRVRSR